MENKIQDGDTIDEDEWYAGLGVVSVTTEKVITDSNKDKDQISGNDQLICNNKDEILKQSGLDSHLDLDHNIEMENNPDVLVSNDIDDDDDMGGVILAEEVNSKSYTNIPYCKAILNNLNSSKI